MGENSGIAWTHHTFNPWWGCVAVSEACAFCYAEAWSRRFGGDLWGPHATYRTFGDKHWNEPRRWNAAAAKAGERRRVFCASMADVFDNRAPEGARDRLWALIRETPSLDWLVLTKRPQNVTKMLPPNWGAGYPNVWLGTTVENQVEANRRIPHLLRVPAAIHFLSCEPLLEAVDLRNLDLGSAITLDALTGYFATSIMRALRPGQGIEALLDDLPRLPAPVAAVDWVIMGGESGKGARPYLPEWPRALMAQGWILGTAFFHKQAGSLREGWTGITGKGDDPAEWPSDLRVQDFPRPVVRAVAA